MIHLLFATMKKVSMPDLIKIQFKEPNCQVVENGSNMKETDLQIKCQIDDLKKLNECILDWSRNYLS